jgi:ferrochelatase
VSEREQDAILLVAFGGPTRPEDIRPFLAHVLRGRPVPPSRIEEVAHHYELIGGRSPLNDLTEQQRAALEARLRARGITLPVALGMRHAAPFVADVLRDLVLAGTRRVLVVIMAAFHDHATVERYAMSVDDAAKQLDAALTLAYASGPSEHAGFVAASVDHIRAAFARLPAPLQADADLVFTAHSVPTAVGQASGYVALYEDAARRIAQALGRAGRYRLAYQSRSGSPREPWLEPDICEVIKEATERGTRAVVAAPIAFVCDHVEVLYDLDVEAAAAASAGGIAWARASTVGNHPAYIEALADRVAAGLQTLG